MPGLGGSHHLPPYSILCASQWDQHSNVIFSQNSQVKIWKFLKLGFSQFWGPITLCANLRLRWGLKKNCNPCQNFNGMSHATCTKGNRGDSWLLVVGGQIGNLIFDFFFSHNMCLKCLNGSREPISEIYDPKDFQWYKEDFNPMGFDPYNCFLKIQKSIMTPTPKMGAHLGMWGFISSHFPTLPGAWDVTPGFPLLARTFLSLYLGHKPKAKVATLSPTRRRGQCFHWHLKIIFSMQLLSFGSLAINC